MLRKKIMFMSVVALLLFNLCAFSMKTKEKEIKMTPEKAIGDKCFKAMDGENFKHKKAEITINIESELEYKININIDKNLDKKRIILPNDFPAGKVFQFLDSEDIKSVRLVSRYFRNKMCKFLIMDDACAPFIKKVVLARSFWCWCTPEPIEQRFEDHVVSNALETYESELNSRLEVYNRVPFVSDGIVGLHFEGTPYYERFLKFVNKRNKDKFIKNFLKKRFSSLYDKNYEKTFPMRAGLCCFTYISGFFILSLLVSFFLSIALIPQDYGFMNETGLNTTNF